MKKTMPSLEQVTAAARRLPDNARVPYAFEKRVLHAVCQRRPLDAWSIWTQTLWRAAGACVAISLLTGAFAQLGDEPEELLASDLEQTVMAAIKMDESW
jgi:hypothetical protein